jgi:general secretion pathway protein N
MIRIVLAALLLIVTASAGPAQAPAQPQTGSVRSFALPPLEALQATRERPLFAPKRRPDDVAAPPEAPVVEESPESVSFELTGVVMGGALAIAILRNRDTGETQQLRQGDMLADWSVEEIGARHVVLRQEDRQVRLELFPEKPEGAGEVPALLPPAPRRTGIPARQAGDQPARRASPLSPAQQRAQRRNLQPRRPQNP